MRKRILCCCIILMVIFQKSYCQSYKLDWANGTGGKKNATATDIALDKEGNSYTTGFFYDTVDFDPGKGVFLLNADTGKPHMFITKTDASGKFVWAKSIGDSCTGHTILTDSLNNLYVCGMFTDTVDFDPGPAAYKLDASHNSNVFIAKYDSSGNLLFAKAIQPVTNGRSFCHAFSLDSKFNILIAGLFVGNLDFNPGSGVYPETSPDYDLFLLKLNTSGEFLWNRRPLYSTSLFQTEDMQIDIEDNILLTGAYLNTASFGGFYLSSMGSSDVFITKIDSGGNVLWANSVGNANFDMVKSIYVDSAKNIFIAGTFSDKVDFDPGPGYFELEAVSGYINTFTLKLTESGNFIWAKALSGAGYVVPASIKGDAANGVYTIGAFSRKIDFDPGSDTFFVQSIDDNFDVFVQKTDTAGHLILLKTFGGKTSDQAIDFCVDNNANIFSIGTFTSVADFNPGFDTFAIKPIGSKDIFVQKLSPCTPLSEIVHINACEQYTIKDQTFTKNGTYLKTISSVGGCDSTITLNLTLEPKTAYTVTQKGAELEVLGTTASYQWVTCPSYTYIPGATDKKFVAVKDGNYAVIIIKGPCVEISDCYNITGLRAEDAPVKGQLMVFPNPSTGIFSVFNDLSLEDYSYKLYDVSGKLIMNKEHLYESSFIFDITAKPNGLYFLTVYNSKEIIATVRITKD